MIIDNLVKRPEVYTAFQWTGTNLQEAHQFIQEHLWMPDQVKWSVEYLGHGLGVLVIEGVRVRPDAWVIARDGVVKDVVEWHVFRDLYANAPALDAPPTTERELAAGEAA